MSRNERVGIGAVAAGALVALALTALPLLVGLAVLASSGGLDFATALAGDLVAAAWLVVSAAFGTFFGARTAAMSSRAVLRRDGALAGFVTASLISLAALGAACYLAAFWPAARAAEFLWGLVGLELVLLFAGWVGGMTGARSEARAARLRAVWPGRRASDSLEEEFFEGGNLPDQHAQWQ